MAIDDINGSSVFWQGQSSTANLDASIANRKTYAAQGEALAAQREAAEATDAAKDAREDARGSAALLARYEQVTKKLVDKLDKTEAELESYKSLLSKQNAEIAQYKENVDAAFRQQQEKLATWMVGQRAFKELAIEFGTQAGKSKEEVVKMGLSEMEEKVLNNETKHGNNAEDLKTVKPFIEKLKKQLKDKLDKPA